MHQSGPETTESRPDDPPVRVLYIMGCGRSGSTVLDAILGNHPEIESVGEVCHAVRKAWLEEHYCGCGQWGGSCSFWPGVRRQWIRRAGTEDVADYVAMLHQLEAKRIWLPRLVRKARRAEPRYREYLNRTAAMFAAIHEVSGKSIIVDSSKRASRALALSMIPGIDLRLIHLVRDCRGVVWSRKKKFSKDIKRGFAEDPGKRVWNTTMRWNVANLQASWVRRRLPKSSSIRIRYEDYVTQPEKEMERIGRLIDVDLSGLARAVTQGQAMGVGHMMAGNRLRMTGSVRLRPDTEWVTKLSAVERGTCWALSRWLMRHYGYGKYPVVEEEKVSVRRAA